MAGADLLKGFVPSTLAPSMATALAAEATMAVTPFLLPTVAMGALFGHLGTRAQADLPRSA